MEYGTYHHPKLVLEESVDNINTDTYTRLFAITLGAHKFIFF